MTRALDLTPDSPPPRAYRELDRRGLHVGMIVHTTEPIVTTCFRERIEADRRITTNAHLVEGELFWHGGWSIGWWEPRDYRPALMDPVNYQRVRASGLEWRRRTHDWKHGIAPSLNIVVPGRRPTRHLEVD